MLPWLLWPLRILPVAQIPPIAEGNALVLASPSLVTVRDDTARTVDRSHFFFFLTLLELCPLPLPPMLASSSSLPPLSSMLSLLPRANGCLSDSDFEK